MHTMPETEVFVTVGVDTHKDIHVAVALDQLGRILDKIEIPTTSAGYAELLAWAPPSSARSTRSGSRAPGHTVPGCAGGCGPAV